MPCEICDTIQKVEEWNKPWSDETLSGPDAFQKLLYLRHVNDSLIYKCPECGQVYLSITWNELFPDGWTEFTSLRKLNSDDATIYLNQPE